MSTPVVDEDMHEDSNESGVEDDEYEDASHVSDESEKLEIAEYSDDADNKDVKKATDRYRIKKKTGVQDAEKVNCKSKKEDSDDGDQKKAENKDEEKDEEEEDDDELSKYVVQHGAHREYRVREKFILHEAKRPMPVRDGHHIGALLNRRSVKLWEGLKWSHVTILGGKLTTSGNFESCPYVCFKPIDDSVVSDDEVWLRPIHANVMEHYQPLWTEEIQKKYKATPDRAKRLIDQAAPGGYKLVLEWNAKMVSGQKLEIQQLGIGKHGMLKLEQKLKSIRINPKGDANAPSKDVPVKLNSAISKKTKNAFAGSSADNESETSDTTAMPQARTIKIGPSATTKTFEADGVLYATFLV